MAELPSFEARRAANEAEIIGRLGIAFAELGLDRGDRVMALADASAHFLLEASRPEREVNHLQSFLNAMQHRFLTLLADRDRVIRSEKRMNEPQRRRGAEP